MIFTPYIPILKGGITVFNIQTKNKISSIGLDRFNENYFIADEMENPDAIILRSASLHEMEFPSSLKAIARAGAGVNNIPVDRCSEQGIVVFNTPGANANAVKELVLCGLFLASRKVVPGIDWAKTLKGNGAEVGKMVEKGKGAFVGPEIAGKKLGVIGLGAIGGLVANAATHLGMEVIGYDNFISVDAAWHLSRSVKKAASLKEIYENCDYITIHVPYMADTKNYINAENIAMMKDGVRILNFSRGELVNSDAIIEAVKSGKVACYVTDFANDDQLCVDNIICMPHLGASTPESEDNCARMAADELIAFLNTGNIKNSVNFPNVEAEMTGDKRICIMHRNVPTLIAQFTNALAGLNIENLVNKSRKDMAYTIIDVTGEVTDKMLEDIKAVDGVVGFRVI